MPTEPAPTLRLAFDGEALAANWRALDQLSGQAIAGAAVKADGYGLGVERVVPVLRNAGCRAFYVAHWSEAAAVAAHVAADSIAVLHGPSSDADVAYARESGTVPVINSPEQARRWLAGGGGPCQLMVDTGMNRLGVRPGDLCDEAVGTLDVRLVMSHLACADEDSAMNAAQLARAQSAFARFPAAVKSLANSAAIALGAEYHFDVTRPGLALYGGVPRAELAPHVATVVRPEAAIIQLREVPSGESVGYNATFTAPRDMRVGIVSLGYADGYLRAWSDRGMAMLHGQRVPVIGRVSMDMIALDCTAVAQAREGDWATIAYDLPEASAISGLSQYELLTGLGQRFGR